MVWASEGNLRAWSRATSPLIHSRLEAAFFPRGPGCDVDHKALTKSRLRALLGDFESELSRFTELRAVGHCLLEQRDDSALRLGCIWLGLFPDVDTLERVARIALDDERSLAVRDQAAWTLCFRQRQTRDPNLYWAPEAEALADTALLKLLERGALTALPQLGAGLRHVAAAPILDWLARDVVAAKDALECFATPALARTALDAALALDSGASGRALRLASCVLGEQVVPELRAALSTAPTLAQRIGG